MTRRPTVFFLKPATEATVACPVRLRMPPCSHRPVTAMRRAVDRCASDRRIARAVSIELGESLMPKLRSVRRRRRRGANCGRGRDRFRPGSFVREDQRAIPITGRNRDSDHASNVGRSVHRRRPDRQDDAGSASNTLRCRVKAGPARKAGRHQCDLNHIARFEPVLSSQHQNVMHASLQAFNSED